MLERRSNIPKETGGDSDSASAGNPLALLSAGDIEARLEGMSVDDLKQAVRLSNAALGGVAMITDEEAFKAIKMKLLHGGLSEKDINKALPSLREVIDRTKGKAPQTITQNVNLSAQRPLLTDEECQALIDKWCAGNVEPVTIENQ